MRRVLACPAFDAGERNRSFPADEAAHAVAAILDPDCGALVATDLASRHVAPELVPLLVAGLAKAGLHVPERGTAA